MQHVDRVNQSLEQLIQRTVNTGAFAEPQS